jgi:hypothetical protein
LVAYERLDLRRAAAAEPEGPPCGVKASSYGRFTEMEGRVHTFDLHVADRYAADGVVTPLNKISKMEASARPGELAGSRKPVAGSR